MTISHEDTITTALGSIRSGLQVDGFDLYLAEASEDGNVVICLEAKPTACLDCLVPDDMLQQIVESAIRRAQPSVRAVTLVKAGFDGVESH